MISFRLRVKTQTVWLVALTAATLFAFPMTIRADESGFEATLAPAQPIVGQLVTVRVQATDLQGDDRFVAEIRLQGSVVASANALAGPVFQIAFTPQSVGTYAFSVRKDSSLQVDALATKIFVVISQPASGQEIAQGVLILLIAGGVIIALAIAAIIILRWPRRRKEIP